jgi:CBS domain-containing protein
VDRVLGLVTREQLAHAMAASGAGEAASSLVKAPMVHAHPDHPSDIVLQRLSQAGGLLPVISRDQTSAPMGVVTLDGIVRFLDGYRREPPDETRPGTCYN